MESPTRREEPFLKQMESGRAPRVKQQAHFQAHSLACLFYPFWWEL
eukprot:NP_497869.2 Uncharacterized protein CELE_H38K22.4 [Caenorhabditis elegans]